MPTVHLLDYVAGNVLSLVNAIEKLGYTIEWIKTPEDVEKAEVNISTRYRVDKSERALLTTKCRSSFFQV